MIVIDGGIQNIQTIRDLSLQLKYEKSKNFRWPGHRVNLPIEVANSYTNFVSDHLGENLTFFEGFFQYVDKSWISGSCHFDETKYTSITFLNPKPNKNSGIEIYDEKYYSPKYGNMISEFNSTKKIYYKSQKNIFDISVFKLKLKMFNSNFKNPLIIENKFNRTVVFDSHRIHRAQNFFGNNMLDSRMTLISFFL